MSDEQEITPDAIVGPRLMLRKIIEKLERGECEAVSMEWWVGERDVTQPGDTVRKIESDGNHTVVLKFKERVQ